MLVRIIKGNRETDISCSHVSKEFYPDRIEVELINVNGEEGTNKWLVIPRDGKAIYFMTNGGRTQGAVHWPRKGDKDKNSDKGNGRDGGNRRRRSSLR